MESSFVTSVEHPQLPTLRNIHRSINDTINEIQGKTTRILQDQERDLLKCFRARLAEISEELEKERKKNESGSVEWVSKCKKLTEEVEFLRGNLDKVTEENKTIQKENKKYKRQLKTQNEDREFLIKQLVAVKKENAKLRQYVEQHLSEATIKAEPLPEAGDPEDTDKIESPIMLQRSHNREASAKPVIPARSSSSMAGTYSFSRPSSQAASSRNRPQSAAAGSKSPTSAQPARSNSVASGPIPAPGLKHLAQVTEMEQRYKNVIAKLKVQLETEQSRLRQVKCAYNEEVTNRTELQNVLQNCVEEVWRRERSPTADRPASSLDTHTASSPSLVNPANLSEDQRVALMAKFLANEQVMKLVFSKIHPSSNATKVDEFATFAEQTLSPAHITSGGTAGFGDSILSSGSVSTRAYAPPDPSDMRINIPTHTHFDKESPSRVGSSSVYAATHSPLRLQQQQHLLHQNPPASAEERMKWFEERSIIPPQPAPEPPIPEKQIISSVIQSATAAVQADPYLSGRVTPSLAIGTPKALHSASSRFGSGSAKRPPSATAGRPASRTSFGSSFPFAARS